MALPCTDLVRLRMYSTCPVSGDEGHCESHPTRVVDVSMFPMQCSQCETVCTSPSLFSYELQTLRYRYDRNIANTNLQS